MSEVSRNLFVDKVAARDFLAGGPLSLSGIATNGLIPGLYADYKYRELKKKGDNSPWRKTYGAGMLSHLGGYGLGAVAGGAVGGPIGASLGGAAGAGLGTYLGAKGGAEGLGIQHILPTLGGIGAGAGLGYLAADALSGKYIEDTPVAKGIGAGLGAIGGGLGGYYLSKWMSE